jgi:hypothetical protein
MRSLLIAMITLTCAVAADVDGTWQVTLDAIDRTNPDGSSVQMPRMEATMMLKRDGNSLTGTWQVRDTWTLSGKVADDGTFELISESRSIPIVIDGQTTTGTAQWVIRGAPTADMLSGTAYLQVQKRPGFGRPWSATRK